MQSPPEQLQGEEPPYAVECEACDWRRYAVSEYTAEKMQSLHTRSLDSCGEFPEVIELDD